jgi:hypothetical protein
MKPRHLLPLPAFVGVRRVATDGNGYSRGVLKIRHLEMWSCEHEHENRRGAHVCAIQARGQAIAAGYLPETPARPWTDY